MAKQLGFAIEQDICMGCKACQVACKDKKDLEVGQLLRKVYAVEGGEYVEDGNGLRHSIYSFWTTMSCNHCESPVCADVCPTSAIYKRDEDGIVLIDEEECIGCGACRESCLYDAPSMIVEEEKMGKCDFCVDLVVQGQDPICVGSCPVRALHYGEIEELRDRFGIVDTVKGVPESVTKPALVIVPHKDAI